MSALKLFVSHSSRLDDVEHQYSRGDRNWRLLEDTCKAIRQKYGDRVEVLVDKDGLLPGDKWNHQLNLWLAECHRAIILFSKRAIEKSDWVAKEAAILSWRAELDEKFILIPVMLDGESTPEDLAREFLGVLQIDANQCIQNAQTADDIVKGIAQKLGEPEDLAGAYPQTPLERIQGGIAKLLADGTTTDSLKEALERVECPVASAGHSDHERYAHLVARRLIESTTEQPLVCFKLFQLAVDPLKPVPSKEWVNALFKVIRSLWVDPRAAACIPLACHHKRPLALAGNLVNSTDTDLSPTTGYTLARYLERAWPGTKLFYPPITLTKFDTLEQMQDEIRRTLLNPQIAAHGNAGDLDRWINDDPKMIFVVASPANALGDLPDARQRAELCRLSTVYPRAVVILNVGFDIHRLPDDVREVVPCLDCNLERAAQAKELMAKRFVDNFGLN